MNIMFRNFMLSLFLVLKSQGYVCIEQEAKALFLKIMTIFLF